MSQAAASILLSVFAIATASPEAARADELRITVYDKSGLAAPSMARMARDLNLIFQHAEIEVHWVVGNLDEDESTFVKYTNIVSRQHERRLGCSARRDVAVAVLPSAGHTIPEQVLGMAMPFSNAGLNVQVYRDHIAGVALSRNVAEADLLAHAIAHEIGHVLLRSQSHTGSGLMNGIWREREYGWIGTGSMFFTPQEASRIRATMNGTGCPASLAAR